MLFALKRADGSVAITTLIPRYLITSDDGRHEIAITNGATRKLKVDGVGEVPFDCDVRDLTADSVADFGTLEFPNIAEEIKRMPYPDEIVSYHRITTADLPTTREYRNGWQHDGTTISHNMVKCRELHREKMRAAREPKLEALDIEYVRADEAGDAAKKKDIAARKQVLRDVTADPAIAAAKTVDELKAVWPDCLK